MRFVNHTRRGYVGDSKATEQTFSEGWMKTGDILRMDENRNFWVTDRLKEVWFNFFSHQSHPVWNLTNYWDLDDQIQGVG